METNKLIEGVNCPKCGTRFKCSFWYDGTPKPTEEELADPQAGALIVCEICLTILMFHPPTKEIHVASPAELDQVPAEVLQGARHTQRQLYFRRIRFEAQKIARDN